jgi:hypothetical protein
MNEVTITRGDAMMSTRITIVGLVTACLFLHLMAFPQVVDAKRPVIVKIGSGQAMVTFLSGVATVTSSEETRVRVLKVGDSLKEGDDVTTAARSRLEIMLPDASVLRFADSTNFKIQQIEISKKSGKRNMRVKVAFGRTWASIKKFFFGLKPRVEVSATNAVCGVRGTTFRMNVNEDQSMLVRTYEGEVNVSKGSTQLQPPTPVGPPHKISGPTPVPGPKKVTMEEWTYIIRSMQQIRISSDGIAEKPEAFTEQEDRNEWVDWNKSRDDAVRDIDVSLEDE